MKPTKKTILLFTLFITLLTAKPFIIGYYPWYRTESYPPSEIPLDKISHIVHSFIWPGTEGNIITPNNFFNATPNLISTAHDKGAKVVLSIGGGGNGENFDVVMADTTKRTNFIDNLLDICLEYGYDGIDIDWEQPDSQQDKKNLNHFVIELYEQIEKWQAEISISISVPASDWRGKYYDTNTLKKYIQWFGIMAYDFYGSWSSTSGFNSSLFKDPSDPQNLNMDYSIRQYWHSIKEVDYSQLVAGIPFYGYEFEGADGPYKQFSKCDSRTYVDIVVLSGFENHWNMSSKVPYLTKDNSFISYDDTTSVGYKCEYALEKSMAGVMIWELSQSYFSIENQPLLETIIKKMNQPSNNIKKNNNKTPTSFSISQNYPNPFNSRTNFRVSIPTSNNLQMNIYNVRGNLVEKLYDGIILPGQHDFTWNVNSETSTGIYILKINFGNYGKRIKMIYIK